MSGGWTSRKGSAGAGAGVRGLGPADHQFLLGTGEPQGAIAHPGVKLRCGLQPTQAISPMLSSQQAERSEAPAPSAWEPAVHTPLTLPTSSFQVVDYRLSSGKLPPDLTGVQEAG
ncbi:uncharacterized protein LOC129398371 [Pan paniscus]|uniref:uncharacterized protein LOC129398371 n=1 Tax=Pan paniscus TaxID=9597 RepID=UPI0025464A38|nr:uncharacterized protein LOC129398371 [Pan paniscus]